MISRKAPDQDAPICQKELSLTKLGRADSIRFRLRPVPSYTCAGTFGTPDSV